MGELNLYGGNQNYMGGVIFITTPRKQNFRKTSLFIFTVIGVTGKVFC